MNRSQTKKLDLVMQGILGRLTDFQLTSTDEEFFNLLEDLREYIVNYNHKEREEKQELNQLELFGE